MTLFPIERVVAVLAWQNNMTGERALTTWSGETKRLITVERPGLGMDHRLTEVWELDAGETAPPGCFYLSAFVKPGDSDVPKPAENRAE